MTQLERELKIKSIEIRDLRDKLAFYQSQQTQQQQVIQVQQPHQPSFEIDQIKRDKSVAVGLVNQMQKDLSTKDVTISKLAREIEGFKRELKESEQARKELDEKLRLATDKRKMEEEQILKEKELVVLRSVR